MAHYQAHPLSTPKTAHSFLDQEKIWVNRELESMRIKDMDPDYLLATMTFLLRRADELKFAMEMYYTVGAGPSGDMAQEAFDAEFAAFLQLDAKVWMKGTKLFQRMMKRYRKGASFGQPKIRLPLLEVVSGREY